MRRYVSSALLVAVLVASIPILSLSQVEAATITEWIIPTVDAEPTGVFVDGGLVYFTENYGNKIGRLSDIGRGTSTTCSAKAVGGFIESVNTFALVVPWLVVIGVVGCVGVVAVVAKKRRQ